jgi:hypothetical protein
MHSIQNKFDINNENEYIELEFSPSTTNSFNGKSYTELGLDMDGEPAVYLLPDSNFECILSTYFTINNNLLYCNVLDVEFI